MSRTLSVAMVAALTCGGLAAQTPTPALATFDVVSIKRNPGTPAGGTRMLPDGSFTMTNQAVSSILIGAAPVPVREVVGLPGWATEERYDIIAKAPEGSALAQRGEMMRAMFIERMKLVAHVEEQERSTFALVLARDDGRLGPQLKPSSLDCTPRALAPGSQPPPLPARPLSLSERQSRCGGISMGRGQMASGGVTMDQLVQALPTGGVLVHNRTGLQGSYAITLNFSPPRGFGAEPLPPDAPPEVFTAIQEQLGLKLIPEKTMVPVLVVDHIERPTPD